MELENIVLRCKNRSDGFYIFRSQENELLCRRVEEGKLCDKAEILADNDCAEFDAIIDFNNTLHIVMGKRSGDVIYLRRIDGVWKKATLLKLKAELDTKTESLFVFGKDEQVIVIYLAFCGGRKMICCQCISEKIESPVVIAEADGTSSIFAFKNTGGDICVFYTDNESGTFGYKKYSDAKSGWSKINVIEDEGRGVKNIFAECDGEEMHVCYKHREGVQFRCINKSGKILDSQLLTRKHIENCAELILNCRDNLLRLFWRSGESMICAVRDNMEKKWSRLAERKIKSAGELIVFKFSDAEEQSFKCDCGTIENNVVMVHDGGKYFKNKSVYGITNIEDIETLIFKVKTILSELENIKKGVRKSETTDEPKERQF